MANGPKLTSSGARDKLLLQEFVLLGTRQSAFSSHGLPGGEKKNRSKNLFEENFKTRMKRRISY